MTAVRRRRQGMAGSILEQFAELKSDYDIGKASRYKRAKTGIMTLGSHADYHYRTEAAYFGAMEMAREMTRNNPLVMQGVRRLVANVVGRGFVLDSDSGDKGIDDVNGYRWAEWSRSPEACDDQQELDFHGLEKLTLQHVIIDGDICSLPNRDGGIESQEGHRLKTPRNTTKNVVHGVQQDERRRRLAYWFTKEDIEPWRSVVRVNDITQIPARDDAGHRQVFHHYLPDRRSQTRGVTAFAPMADTADHWDDLQFANLVAAKIQSCYTILREMDAGAPVLPFAGGGDHSETTETRPDGETRTLTDIAPGFEIYGYKGERLRGFVPTLPGLQFFEHSSMLLGILAVNLDLPLCVFLLDASETLTQLTGGIEYHDAGTSGSFRVQSYGKRLSTGFTRALRRLAERGFDDPRCVVVKTGSGNRSGITHAGGRYVHAGNSYATEVMRMMRDLGSVSGGVCAFSRTGFRRSRRTFLTRPVSSTTNQFRGRAP